MAVRGRTRWQKAGWFLLAVGVVAGMDAFWLGPGHSFGFQVFNAACLLALVVLFNAVWDWWRRHHPAGDAGELHAPPNHRSHGPMTRL